MLIRKDPNVGESSQVGANIPLHTSSGEEGKARAEVEPKAKEETNRKAEEEAAILLAEAKARVNTEAKANIAADVASSSFSSLAWMLCQLKWTQLLMHL